MSENKANAVLSRILMHFPTEEDRTPVGLVYVWMNKQLLERATWAVWLPIYGTEVRSEQYKNGTHHFRADTQDVAYLRILLDGVKLPEDLAAIAGKRFGLWELETPMSVRLSEIPLDEGVASQIIPNLGLPFTQWLVPVEES